MGIVNQSTTEYSSAVGFGNCCKMCNSCLRGEKLQLLQNQQQLSLLQLCSSLLHKLALIKNAPLLFRVNTYSYVVNVSFPYQKLSESDSSKYYWLIVFRRVISKP